MDQIVAGRSRRAAAPLRCFFAVAVTFLTLRGGVVTRMTEPEAVNQYCSSCRKKAFKIPILPMEIDHAIPLV